MRTRTNLSALIGVALASTTLSSIASAATLEVGANKTYKTPCDAIAAAQPNDTVAIDPGTYTDSCSIGVQGLTVKGVGGMPKIDLSGTDHPAGYKGIYVIDAQDVRIENLELTGAHISDGNGANGAGLRVQAGNLTVHGCYFHDNQNGILGDGSGTLTVEYSEFSKNGLGNGCNVGGCTHNLYAQFDTLVFQYNYSHDIATDGHLLKSRSKVNHILYNRLSGENGHDSYAMDFPNGGLAIVVGNVVQKGTKPGNNTLLIWGEEGASNPDHRVFVVSNTFVNDSGGGTFLDVGGATLTAHDNIFAGAGKPSSTGALSADNFLGDPMFVDAAHYDYHLVKGSPAIDVGVDPGSADAFSLKPVDEYVHPTQRTTRLDDGKLDLGAFEFGTMVMPSSSAATGAGGASASSSSGAASGAGGATATTSGSTSSGLASGAGGGANATGGSSSSGCSCETAGGQGGDAPLVVALMCALGIGVPTRRARRARG